MGNLMNRVTRFNLNPQLVRFIDDWSNGRLPRMSGAPAASYHAPKWRVSERLSVNDVAELIAAFKAGTAKWKLAKRYGINEKSVKKLLRERGVKRGSRYDVRQ